MSSQKDVLTSNCGGDLSVLPDQKVLTESIILFKGLADLTRLKILCFLQEGEVCVHDLVEAMNISQSGVSHQLRILRDARLVVSRKQGRHVYFS